MSAERDACLFFNVARIEEAVKAGKFKTIGDQGAGGGRHPRSQQGPKTALTAYVRSQEPARRERQPGRKYFICAGKLSPTATVIELAKVLDWFDGKLEKLDDAIVAEVELGLGPLHTAFDGRGNAFTTLFLDSQIVKWNVDAAIKFHKGDKNAKYVVDRIDVHYQPGHINASQSRPRPPTASSWPWAASSPRTASCRWARCTRERAAHRHLGREDGAAGRPPGARRAARLHHLQARLVKPKQVYNWTTSPGHQGPKESGVFRNGKKVTVKMTSQAPAFSLREFKVKKGDEVTLILTNLDKIEDLTHGFAIPNYNVNFIVNPQEPSRSPSSDKPGVFWCYCTHFCHALHLEMRTRMIVEA
jgi:nitrous-oxide reductase